MTRLGMLRVWAPMLVVAMMNASCGTSSTDTVAPTVGDAPTTTTQAAKCFCKLRSARRG